MASGTIKAVVGRSDIVDNLTTNDGTKVLSAKQGKVLSDQIAPVCGTGKSWITNAELNDYTNLGVYYLSTGITCGGTAVSFSWAVLEVTAGRTDTIIQKIYVGSAGSTLNEYTRHCRNGTWSTPNSLFDQVGTMKFFHNNANAESYAFNVGYGNAYRYALVIGGTGSNSSDHYLGLLFYGLNTSSCTLTNIYKGNTCPTISVAVTDTTTTFTTSARMYGGLRMIFLN